MQATISAFWSRGLGALVRERTAKGPDLILPALETAISRGELRAGAEKSLLARMLWDQYLGAYDNAIYDSWPLGRLMTQLRTQISIVLASARATVRDQLNPLGAEIVATVRRDMQRHLGRGWVTDYIPALARVDPKRRQVAYGLPAPPPVLANLLI